MEPSCVYPTYKLAPSHDGILNIIHVISNDEADHVPEVYKKKFMNDGKVTVHKELEETHYVNVEKSSKFPITSNSFVKFSNAVSQLPDYQGYASDILTNAYKFARKEKPKAHITVACDENTKDFNSILKLVEGKNRSKELANCRGDQDGVPSHFEKLATQFASKNGLECTIIKGDDLVEKENFRLMHAVGRASRNKPVFINLKYNGNPKSDEWVAFVGKGVCFDAGGLNIKPTSGMKQMYLDKHGGVSVFSAFQSIVEEKVEINLTCSMGFVENFVSQNSYRPSDIFKSRKGITVEIGNTDAEGRLVLADCMNWTQQKYKVSVMIELSTLTGAIITALGHRFAGMFGNSDTLMTDFRNAGKTSHEQVWEMPLVDYHRELVKHKFADITNSSGKVEAGSSQAAAFLENFVEKGVKWIHLDIAGVCIVGQEGSGYGSRILIQYARNYAKK